MLWFTLREGGVSTLDLSPGGLFQNATILSTGLSYPVVWVAAWAGHNPTLQTVLAWVIGLAAVGLLVWMVRRSQRVAWFCAGWFVLCIGPVVVTMRPDWLIDAPRFLYPAGVGAALWWGIAITRLAEGHRRGRLLAMGLAMIVALPGAVFAHQGVGWHLRGGTAIWDATGVRGRGVDGSLILNLPEHLAPQQSIYPYFDGGAILLPPQVETWEIFRTNQFGPWPTWAVAMGAIQAPVPYKLTLYGPPIYEGLLDTAIQEGQLIGIADYSAMPIRVWEAGSHHNSNIRILPDTPLAVFSGGLTLWEGGATTYERGVVTVSLYWNIEAPLDNSPTVFVHLVDESGRIIAQGDGDPLGGLHPLSLWDGMGYYLEDRRHIHIPDGMNREGLTIYVGVWMPSTGDKLPIIEGMNSDNRVSFPVERPFCC